MADKTVDPISIGTVGRRAAGFAAAVGRRTTANVRSARFASTFPWGYARGLPSPMLPTEELQDPERRVSLRRPCAELREPYDVIPGPARRGRRERRGAGQRAEPRSRSITEIVGAPPEVLREHGVDETDSPEAPRPMAVAVERILDFLRSYGSALTPPLLEYLRRRLAPWIRVVTAWLRRTGGTAWYWTRSRVRQLVEGAASAVARAAQQARDTARRALEVSRQTARRAWQWAQTRARRAVARASEIARQSLQWARSTAQRVRQRATQLAKEAWRFGQQRIRQAMEGARTIASRAWAAARQGASRLWSWALRIGGRPAEWVAERVRALWARARQVGSTALDRARAIHDRVREYVRSRSRKVWEWALDRAAAVFDWMRNRAGHAWDRAEATGRSAWHRAMRIADLAWRGARITAERARDFARRRAQVWLDRLMRAGRFIWDLRGYDRRTVWDLLSRVIRGTTSWGRSVLRRVMAVGRDLTAPAARFARHAARGARDFVIRRAGRAWTWAKAAAGRAWGFLRSLAGRAGEGLARVAAPLRASWEWGRRRLGAAYRWVSGTARRLLQYGGSRIRRIVDVVRTLGRRLTRSVLPWLRPLVGSRLGRGVDLVRRALRWAQRAGGVASRRMGLLAHRLGQMVRQPWRLVPPVLRRLSGFVQRTLGSALRVLTRGVGVLSERGGALLGRLLHAATRGAGLLGRAAGTVLGRLLRSALRYPSASELLGTALRAALDIARRLDRATGGVLSSLMTRLASGAGSVAGYLRHLLGSAVRGIVTGGAGMGSLLRGLVGRLLGRGAAGAERVRQLTGRFLGRLLGAGLAGLRRADSLTGGLLGRALGAGVRGARVLGRVVGELAGQLMGRATQGAQLVGGLARDVLGRLLGHAARGAGILGHVLGGIISRVTARARESFGVAGGALRSLASRGLGVLARGLGVARGIAGELLVRAVGRGARAAQRLGAFVARGLEAAVRMYQRVLVFQKPLAAPIGHALARIVDRIRPVASGVSRTLTPLAWGVLGATGGVARAAGGTVARIARRVGQVQEGVAERLGRFVPHAGSPILGPLSRPFRAVGSAITRIVGPILPAVAPFFGVGQKLGGLLGRTGAEAQASAARFPAGFIQTRSLSSTAAGLGTSLAASLGTAVGRMPTALAALTPGRTTFPPSAAGAAGVVGSAAGALAGSIGRSLGLFRQAAPGSSVAVAGIDAERLRQQLAASGSSGAPLPGPALRAMQQQLGHDFSDVRIHQDPQAASTAATLGARAFTIGSDVYFGPGRYDPYSPQGQSLLAHELTHVVQQTSGRTRGMHPFSRQGGDTLEQEAQLAARHVLARVGRPQGIQVEDYVRTYETEDDAEITPADQKRLDTISLMALRLAEKGLSRKGYRSDTVVPSMDIALEVDLGEMSDLQVATIWADAIVAKIAEAQEQAHVEVQEPVAPRVMRAPEPQQPQRPRLTLTDQVKAEIQKDAEAITANIRSWWRKPAQMVEPLKRWYEEDKRLFGGLGTPHLDWLLFCLHQRTFNKGTIIDRWTNTLAEVERYLADRPEGASFRLYKSFSQRWKSYTPPEEMEGLLSYIGKRELYAGWMIIKGMSTALTGLADVGIWAFWKTSGWPLRRVLEKFGVKADQLKTPALTPFIDRKFDETADILAKELGIDANEQLFGGVSLKTFSEAGGKVVGGLMTAGALGQAAKAAKAAQVAGNLDRARKIELGLQAVNVGQGLQQAEQLAERIKQLREGPPPLSWSDIVKRPDVWAQVAGIMGTAVGAKMSWSQAKGLISKTAERIGLALNAAQIALLAGAYAMVDEDPTIPASDKAKAKADILAEILTTGALAADSVWGARYETWKQKRAEAHKATEPAAAQSVQKASGPGEPPSPPAIAAKPPPAEAAEPTARPPHELEPAQKSKVKTAKKLAEERAAAEKPPSAASRQALEVLRQLGDWDAMLKRDGAASRIARDAHAVRQKAIKDICETFGATATGTAGPASDIDVTFPTEHARHAAQKSMEQRYGPGWEKLFKASFNSEAMRAHAHLDPRLQLTPAQKATIEARLTQMSERLVLERLKAAAAHSEVARAAFKEEAKRLGVHKSEVQIPRLTKAEVRSLENQQDAAMRHYEKTLKTLEAARARGNTPPEELARLQEKAIRQSLAITERQMRINQAYPDRYLTPGGVKGAVSAEIYGKWDRTAYAQRVFEELAKKQDPKAPMNPRELWTEAYRRARLEERRTHEFREAFKTMTPQEAYQRALMERLEFVEQLAKAENDIRSELGSGAKVSVEEVLQRAASRYELSKYAFRAMDTASKLGIKVDAKLLTAAHDIYKPPQSMGGTAAREEQMKQVFGIKHGTPAAPFGPKDVNLRMTLYAALLNETQKRILDRLHNIIQSQMDIPDLPYSQSHDITRARRSGTAEGKE